MIYYEIPDFIKKQYGGTAHGFKAAARARCKKAIRAVNELRMGCAYFPESYYKVELISKTLEDLASELSVRNWGR